jgi:hypothetical protein
MAGIETVEVYLDANQIEVPTYAHCKIDFVFEKVLLLAPRNNDSELS